MYPFTEGTASFARNRWYIAAWSDEVRSDGLLERWILGQRTIFYRTREGAAVAVDGLCPYRQFPLARAAIKDDNLVCGYHGFTFVPTGECVRVPTQAHVPSGCRLKAYPLVEKWKWLWMWPGDPALADETKIPDHREIGLEDEGWQPVQAFNIDLKARYQILHENLLDLSHLTFLHESIIGRDEIATADV
jgi:phenylpropionate dioxygenase-like ring-hydroxylating dioxygenase large terminal subunit